MLRCLLLAVDSAHQRVSPQETDACKEGTYMNSQFTLFQQPRGFSHLSTIVQQEMGPLPRHTGKYEYA